MPTAGEICRSDTVHAIMELQALSVEMEKRVLQLVRQHRAVQDQCRKMNRYLESRQLKA